ncbi:MAG: hypothetical protein FWF54_01020 [Candidatus Azobacteroides sp.]|nr:hypothetical protein [Candidatus Azobacteroides sp.]
MVDRIMSMDFDYEREKELYEALYKWGFGKYKRTDNGATVKLLSEYF